LRLTLRVHSEFHRTIDATHCASTPIDAMSLLLRDAGSGDARMVFRRWGRAFLEEFARTHSWPAAVHAAIILRKQRRRWVTTERLCSRRGVAKTTLTDHFRKLYGLSLSDYHRRAKLGWAVGELVASDFCVESVALRAGYRSPGSFHEAFRSVTALTPTDVRRLSRDALRDLLDGPVSLRMDKKRG
jgi:AraC-like DNA-binding protein